MRLMGIRQARLERLALSASGRERMLKGWAAAGGEKRIDFSAGVAWFGDILIERGRSSRSGPVRSLPIRLSVSGSSQRGRVCDDLIPLVPAWGWKQGRGWKQRRS